MTLSPEQKQSVAAWVAAGDSLSEVQRRLSEQFQVSMTYMDVRFLIDDLGLELKNRAPGPASPDAGLGKPRAGGRTPAEKKSGILDKLKKAVGAGSDDVDEAPEAEPALEEDASAYPAPGDPLAEAPGAGAVRVDVDRIVRPGAVASGTVTFSDGVSGKWAMDQYGRLMLDTGKKGYQPSAGDVQSFQRELGQVLQRHGY